MTEQELLVDCLQRLNGLSLAYCLTGSMASHEWLQDIVAGRIRPKST